jgi:hypothetical protein
MCVEFEILPGNAVVGERRTRPLREAVAGANGPNRVVHQFRREHRDRQRDFENHSADPKRRSCKTETSVRSQRTPTFVTT